MDRKESIKTLLMGSISLPFLKIDSTKQAGHEVDRDLHNSEPMHSDWQQWPDMPWMGPGFWGNRLQDWHIAGGKAECNWRGENRNLQCLTHQLDSRHEDFLASVEVELLHPTDDQIAGFSLGAKAGERPVRVAFRDYRRDAVFGRGLVIGLNGAGQLMIGDSKSDPLPGTGSVIRLDLEGTAIGRVYQVILTARSATTGREVGRLTADNIRPEDLEGNIALLSHCPGEDQDGPSARFSDWQLSGSKIIAKKGQTFGPICFAQYTLNKDLLKVTTQLAPVETISGHTVRFQVREGGTWRTLQETGIEELSRTARFRIKDWSFSENISYRIQLELPLKEVTRTYTYEGTIAAEPAPDDPLRAAVFSCNKHWGFPNSEVVRNVARQRPDMAMFLGDQIYEGHAGFGVERSQNTEKAMLDYLSKWYMFGWSYREIFRHIPSVFITDDHDVYQGNIWGQGGKNAPVDEGYGTVSQDHGGYNMPADWVRAIERTQTSHLPDPYDPTPVEQGIGVYYTDWTYGGISFGIIEDRKWKTAPGNALPFEIVNGFPQDPDIDLTDYYDIDAELLGERQEEFLENWAAEWGGSARMKVLLSQSPFCGAHTMPQGETNDEIVPRRPTPERGEYPTGDYAARDMDSNGWPQNKRDKALRIIRKSFALHVAGDQHLGSMIQYGVDEYGDAGYAFTLPALNNTWPRRWWPEVGADHRPLPGQPKYTGNFKDAFDNYMTVLSVANPLKTSREPAVLYDRAPGYGMLIFDKKQRRIRCECWPRHVDPAENPEGQYGGWPVEINQLENDGRQAQGFLPRIEVEGMKDPVVQVFRQYTGELEYALRIKGQIFKPKIFDDTLYKVRIGEPDSEKWHEYENVSPDTENRTIKCVFT